jgi:hypothetical protein
MAAEKEGESTGLDRLRRVLTDEVEDAAEGAYFDSFIVPVLLLIPQKHSSFLLKKFLPRT